MAESLVVLCVGGARVDDLVNRLHSLDKLATLLVCRTTGKVQPTVSKIGRPICLCLSPKVVWHDAEHGLHHGEMLKIVVGLKERLARVKLDEDAAD